MALQISNGSVLTLYIYIRDTHQKTRGFWIYMHVFTALLASSHKQGPSSNISQNIKTFLYIKHQHSIFYDSESDDIAESRHSRSVPNAGILR